MSEIIPQDTPIKRASIMQMDPEQLQEYIQTLQTRRLAAYNIYQMGVEAKRKATDEKDAAYLVNTLKRFEKQYDIAKRALDKLEKLATDIQVARIASGDL